MHALAIYTAEQITALLTAVAAVLGTVVALVKAFQAKTKADTNEKSISGLRDTANIHDANLSDLSVTVGEAKGLQTAQAQLHATQASYPMPGLVSAPPAVSTPQTAPNAQGFRGNP